MFWINPVLLELGPISIRIYGLVYFLGFCAAAILLYHTAKNRKIPNLTKERAENLLLALLIGMLIGARLTYFLAYNPQAWLNDVFAPLKLWEGGMSFHGAFLGMIVGAIWYTRKHKISFYKIADLLALPASITLFFGRLANFINAELIGTITNVPWCIDWSKNPYARNPSLGCRHPSQLYEATKNLFIFFTLLSLYRTKKYKDGFIFWLFVLFYGLFRFLVTFFREDPRWLGISEGQWFCLLMILVAGAFLWRGKYFKDNK